MEIKFKKIASELETRISSGKAGERLPSESRLAREFNTSGITIRKALDELQARGMIRRAPRVGTFIGERKKKKFRIAFLNSGLFGSVFRELSGLLERRFDNFTFEFEQVSERDDLKGMDLLAATANTVFPLSFSDDLTPFPEGFMKRFLTRDYFPLPFETYRNRGMYFGLPVLFSPSLLRVNAGVPDWPEDRPFTLETLETLAKGKRGPRRFLWSRDTAFYLLRCGLFSFADASRRLHSVKFPEAKSTLDRLFRLITPEIMCNSDDLVLLHRHFRQSDPPSEPSRIVTYPVAVNDLAGEFLLLPGTFRHSDETLEVAAWFLSEEFQNRLAGIRYGIPVMKTAAMDSFVPGAGADALFLREMDRSLTNNASEYDFLRRLRVLVNALACGEMATSSAMAAVSYEIDMAKRQEKEEK